MRDVDSERLIMTGVMLGALVLWAGIIGESTGLYPDGKTTAAVALGVFVPVFALFVLLLDYLGGASNGDSERRS